MKKYLFNTYTNNIRKILAEGKKLNASDKQTYSFLGDADVLNKAGSSEEVAIEPTTALSDLAQLLGIRSIKKPFKGDHPDFTNVRTSKKPEYHYIVSMFLDVRNSTKLHYNHDLVQIARILQTTIVAATQVCALFGAHIQRIQGDGVFVYFGGRGYDKNQAIQDAINAASFFNYFIKYEFSELFELEDINRFYTRVGVDFGDDKDVMWAVFGTDGCDELTTNSLFTSLPAKMQGNAPNNGIVVGQNVFDRLKDIQSYCDSFRDSSGNVDPDKRYIFQKPDGSFNYAQKVFGWEAYLKNTFPFIKKDEKGKLYIDDQHDAREEAEQKRTAELLQAAQLMNERQSIYNKSVKKEMPIEQHRFFYNNGKI